MVVVVVYIGGAFVCGVVIFWQCLVCFCLVFFAFLPGRAGGRVAGRCDGDDEIIAPDNDEK